MNMTNVKAALTPNAKVLNAIVNGMGEDFRNDVAKMNLSSIDFAIFVVKMTVHLELMKLPEAWDLVFGNGAYNALKDEVYNILESK